MAYGGSNPPPEQIKTNEKMPQYKIIKDDNELFNTSVMCGDRVFCVTTQELLSCGVSDDTFGSGLRRQKSGEVYCWPYHKDGGAVFIHYDGLSEQYKVLIRGILMGGQDVAAWYADNGRLNDITTLFKELLSAVFVADNYKEDIAFIDTFCFSDGAALSVSKKTEYRCTIQWLSFLADVRKNNSINKLGYVSAELFYGDVIFALKRLGVKLPYTKARLLVRVREYERRGAISVISGKLGNGNMVKITPEAGEWIIASYASIVDRMSIKKLHEVYNSVAPLHGWKVLKSSRAIEMYLNRPEVKPLWYGARYGELKAKEIYVRQNRTIAPSCRDALWYSDGTKINLYYLNDKGKVSTCQVYEVIDVYSEVFLGYHISNSENYQAQFRAFKMAIKAAGCKPYELKFDNQGGHKKLQSNDFLKKIAHLSIRTAPYNGKSKTIESAFGRFQAGFLRKWNSTGQNIQAKKVDGKANMEFVLANKANLPNLEGVIDQYLTARAAWNSAPHFKTGMPRIEMYRDSVNPRTQKVEMWDIIDLFWMRSKEPITYTAGGITLTIKGQKYIYEVFDNDGCPDRHFLKRNTGRKFYIYYDIDDMDLVKLYIPDGKSFKYVADAKPYLFVHRAKQDQDELDASFIKYSELQGKEQREELMRESEDIMRKHGTHPEQHGLVMPKIKGLNKKKHKLTEVGQYEKILSNIDEFDENAEHFEYIRKKVDFSKYQ